MDEESRLRHATSISSSFGRIGRVASSRSADCGKRPPARCDPNGQGVPAWPAFSDAAPVVMHFAQTVHTGAVPSAEALKALDAYFGWRRTAEGESFVK